MSVNDPIYIVYEEKYGGFVFMQGRETFYDFENQIVVIEDFQAALDFADENFPTLHKIIDSQPKLPAIPKDQQPDKYPKQLSFFD